MATNDLGETGAGITTTVETQKESPEFFNDLIAVRYLYRRDFATNEIDAVAFDRLRSPFYEGEKWAVRQGGMCLSRDGEWIYEPLPSARDDRFYAECRFPTLYEAKAALEAP